MYPFVNYTISQESKTGRMVNDTAVARRRRSVGRVARPRPSYCFMTISCLNNETIQTDQ